VCRHVLSGYASYGPEELSFMHSIPEGVEREFGLAGLLNRCAEQGWSAALDGGRVNAAKSRFRIANDLIRVFDKILANG